MDQQKDRLISDSMLMIFASLMVIFLNFLFHVFMIKMLGPEGYSILYVVLTIYFIFTFPFNTLQIMVSNYVAKYIANSRPNSVISFFGIMLKISSIAGIFAIIISFVFIGMGNVFLHLQGPFILPCIGFMVMFSLIISLARGFMVGQQRYWLLGANMMSDAFFRLILGISLILIGYKVYGALVGILLSLFLVALLSLIPYFGMLAKGLEENIDVADISRYLVQIFIAITIFALLAHADIILVRHFFLPFETGNYSLASLVGRLLLSIAAAISISLFPKVVSLKAKGSSAKSLAVRSLVFCATILAIIFIVVLAFSGPVIKLIFGYNYLLAANLTPYLCMVMIPFSLTYILITYDLARNKFDFLYVLTSWMILHYMVLYIFHSSISSILIATGSSGFTGLFLYLMRFARSDD